jgi:hypothetical protein
MCLFATQAGLEASREPPTSELLLGYWTEEECRLLFPKKQTRDAKEMATQALELKHQAKQRRREGEEAEALICEAQVLRMQENMSDQQQGRRVDVCLRELASDDVRWVDVSAIHSTARTYRADGKSFVKSLAAAEDKAAETGDPNPMKMKPSKSLEKALARKYNTYHPITQVADLQMGSGERQNGSYKFVPAVCTHSGEFAPEVFNLISWIVGCYKRLLKTGPPRSDGRSVAFCTARLRTRIKDALAARLAAGFGGMLTASGTPETTGRSRKRDARGGQRAA